jgi:hypothetical protein
MEENSLFISNASLKGERASLKLCVDLYKIARLIRVSALLGEYK